MKPYLLGLLITLILSSCSTTHYESHKGLIFKTADWEANLEQPFVINEAVEPELGTEKLKVFFPAQLFEDVEIVNVYYNGMNSTDITHLNDEKNRLLIYFDYNRDLLTDFPYDLELDQAIVEIKVNGYIKTIKLEDIRVPYYHDKVLTTR